jgi:hypothetical protein
MTEQFPFMPQALMNNPYSQAYFASFRQFSQSVGPTCAWCRDPLPNQRMTDGNLCWCHEGHHKLWAAWQLKEKQRREMINRGSKVLPE